MQGSKAATDLQQRIGVKALGDGKYQLIFDGAPEEIKPIRLKEGEPGPQGPFYVQRDKLLKAANR